MKYRDLNWDEIIQKGDQYFIKSIKKWAASELVGWRVGLSGLQYRRPIKPKKKGIK